MQQLNRNRIGEVGLLVDGGHVEVRDVSESELLKRVGVLALVKDGVESLVKWKVRKPEHGRREKVEEILDLKLILFLPDFLD